MTPEAAPSDTRQSSQPTAPVAETVVAAAEAPSLPNPAAFEGIMMRAGGPVDREGLDDKLGTSLTNGNAHAQTQALTKQAQSKQAQTQKSGEKGLGRIRVPPLPPQAETYKQGEFLIAKPSRELLLEMDRRGYKVGQANRAGLALVSLPTGAPNAWDVQRELETAGHGEPPRH